MIKWKPDSLSISFYSPLKSIESDKPSGDLVIFRSLVTFFENHGIEALFTTSLSGRRRKYFEKSFNYLFLGQVLAAWVRTLMSRPSVLFSYHVYYKAPDWIHPFVSFVTRKPYVIYEGSFKPSLRETDFIHYWLMRFTFWQASLIVCAGLRDYETLRRFFPDKTIYVKPGVFLDLFKREGRASEIDKEASSSAYHVASMAMLRDKKKYPSVIWLVDVLSELQKEGHDVVFHHIGGGDNYENLSKYCSGKLRDKTYFLYGTLEQDKAYGILDNCHVFAYPGIGESFGMVYLEAQSLGLPVVAFDNGGVPEAVKQGVSGFLVPPFDKQEFKKKLLDLKADEDLRKKLSIQATSYIESEHNNTKSYQLILDQLLRLVKRPQALAKEVEA